MVRGRYKLQTSKASPAARAIFLNYKSMEISKVKAQLCRKRFNAIR